MSDGSSVHHLSLGYAKESMPCLLSVNCLALKQDGISPPSVHGLIYLTNISACTVEPNWLHFAGGTMDKSEGQTGAWGCS